MDRFGANDIATLAGVRRKSLRRPMDNVRIEDVARRLFEGLPEAARTMRRDIESNFRAVLQSSLGKLDLTTREEFEVQTKVLERTRARIGELELRIVALEKRLTELEEAIPPISD
jgi:BMFP domain-containing protein YqiC